MPDFGDIDPNTGQPSQRTQWEGSVDPLAPSVTNGQITPAQWAEYQSKRRRDAILGMLGVLGGTVGLGFAGQALTGGAGALAGGGAAAGPVGGLAGGSVAGPVGGLAGAGAGIAGAAGAGGAGAAAGGGAGGAGLLGGLSARDIAGLGLGGAGLIGGALSGRPDNSANSMATDPQMKEILDMMMGRLRKSEPLHDSVLSMANGLLPTQYQNGGGGGR